MTLLIVRGNKNLIGYCRTLGIPILDAKIEVGFLPGHWFENYDRKGITKYLIPFLRTLDKRAKFSWGTWTPLTIFWESQPVPSGVKNLFRYYDRHPIRQPRLDLFLQPKTDTGAAVMKS